MRAIEWLVSFCIASTGAIYLVFLINSSLLGPSQFAWIAFIGWFGLAASAVLFVSVASLAFARLVTRGNVRELLQRRIITLVNFPVAAAGYVVFIRGA